MDVYWIQGKKLKKIDEPYVFLNGDVYVVDAGDKIWVWLGSKAYCDDKGVGAWSAQRLDRGDASTVLAVHEGDEDEEFLEIISFKVEEGDTPGFLIHIDTTPMKEFHLYRLHSEDTTIYIDDAIVTEVPISKKSLDSGDVFVLDAYDAIFVWIGKEANISEKYEGNQLSRKIDVERSRIPQTYTFEEGAEPPAFWELLSKLESSGAGIYDESKKKMKGKAKRKAVKTAKKSFLSRLKFW